MKIKLNSIFVDDQEMALKFYTEILGFVKKTDIPFGKNRWLTVVSSDEPNGTELVLEPNDNPAAKTFKEEMFNQNIPFTAFEVQDIQSEYKRLKSNGVVFTMEPKDSGPIWLAAINDTCGNIIQLYQPK